MRFLAGTLVFLFSVSSFSIDKGFRMSAGYCNKDRQPGLNPDHYGECGNMARGVLVRRTGKDMNLKGANLNSSYFYVTHFEGGDLSFMALRESRILQASFKNLKAQYLDLRGAHLKSVTFEKVDLDNLLAMGTRFVKTSFKNSSLKYANFWGSNLQEANFEGSDLSGTDLSNTFLLFTHFKGAKFDNETRLPFSEEEALKKGMVKIEPISEKSDSGD